MIKIEFSGLSFQDEDFKDETFSEGFLIPGEDDIIPISSEWNSEIYDVQYIVYDTYSFTLYLRDSKYQSFQKIQYANKIIIYHSEENFNNNLYFKVIDFKAEKYLNEFWKIELVFKDLSSKIIENTILSEKLDVFNIINPAVIFSTYINLPVIDNVEFSQSIIDDFKDRLINYTKTSELKMVRFYLLANQLIDFYQAIEKINNLSNERIKIGMEEYRQFIPKKEDIGNDLFEITLILYKENRITV